MLSHLHPEKREALDVDDRIGRSSRTDAFRDLRCVVSVATPTVMDKSVTLHATQLQDLAHRMEGGISINHVWVILECLRMSPGVFEKMHATIATDLLDQIGTLSPVPRVHSYQNWGSISNDPDGSAFPTAVDVSPSSFDRMHIGTCALVHPLGVFQSGIESDRDDTRNLAHFIPIGTGVSHLAVLSHSLLHATNIDWKTIQCCRDSPFVVRVGSTRVAPCCQVSVI
jgi:hypothetical protein